MQITKSDIDNTLSQLANTTSLGAVLNKIDSSQTLLRVLSNYMEANAIFGAGVAGLASSIGVRSVTNPCFKDPNTIYTSISDASYEVAGRIFYAAIDEFNVAKGMHPHQSLAQATLQETASFLKVTNEQLSEFTHKSTGTRKAIQETVDGYGLGRVLDDQELFQAIGLHIGSEILADGEFNELDTYLKNSWPKLVAHLQKTSIDLHGQPTPTYVWVDLHTTVEIEHFDAALEAANRALLYYTGDKAQAKQWLLDGISKFSQVQSDFFTSLMLMN
jgi:hypothetical protein